MIVGVPVRHITIIIIALSSIFSGIAGILLALDVGIRPTIGLQPILLGVVAVVIGIRGGERGIVLAALFIAFFQNLVAANIGPHWQDAIAFFILLIFLLLRSKASWRNSV